MLINKNIQRRANNLISVIISKRIITGLRVIGSGIILIDYVDLIICNYFIRDFRDHWQVYFSIYLSNLGFGCRS